MRAIPAVTLRLAVLGAIAAMCATPSAQAASPPAATMGFSGAAPRTLLSLTGSAATGMPLGDIDGDGLSDLAVAARDLANESDPDFGTHVIFGRRTHANVDLSRPTTRSGFLEDFVVEGVGDVNGDGYRDALATYLAFAEGQLPVSAVVFGGPGIADVRLDRLGSRGFLLLNGFAHGVGDVNGDGRADLLAATEEDYPRVSLIYGRAATSPVDIANPGADGLELPEFDVLAVTSATPAGDANGDGIGDLATAPNGAGIVVVFGQPVWTPLDPRDLGSRGYRVTGATELLGSAGDVTGDGRDDLLVGTFTSYVSVAPGQAGTGDVVVGTPAAPADAIVLEAPGAPLSAAPAGDVTGDGRDDLLVNALTGGGNFTTHLVAGRTAPAVVPVADAPRIRGTAGRLKLSAVGDVDGDRRPDVGALEGDVFAERGLLITGGRDVLPPRLTVTLQPSASFRPGPDAVRIVGEASEDVTALVTVKRVSGQLVGIVLVPLTGGRSSGTWDGRVNGRALAPGDYRSTVVPVDAAGNRGASQTVSFTILP